MPGQWYWAQSLWEIYLVRETIKRKALTRRECEQTSACEDAFYSNKSNSYANYLKDSLFRQTRTTRYTMSIPSRHLRGALALARSITNNGDGPFATKQRLIYAVIKGRPSFSSFVCIYAAYLQPVFLGVIQRPSFLPAGFLRCIFLFPAPSSFRFLSVSRSYSFAARHPSRRIRWVSCRISTRQTPAVRSGTPAPPCSFSLSGALSRA